MEFKSKKNFFKFLLLIYVLLIICLSPFLIFICLIGPFAYFHILGIFSFFLSIAIIKYFFWEIPRSLCKKSGLKKNFSTILPISLLLISICLGVINLPTKRPNALSKQIEAYTSVSSYLKAAEAYYGEFGQLATSTKDLGEYISITGCKTNDNRICRNNSYSENYTDLEITKWYLPSGRYEIEMKSDNDKNIFVATPTGKFKKEGLGVSGCFNSKNGKTKILKMETKGTTVEGAIQIFPEPLMANCDV